MSPARKRLWLAVKSVAAAVVVGFVGWHFYKLLTSDELTATGHPFAVRPGYLALAGLAYLGCHTIWATFWWQLLRGQGTGVSWPAAVRAYFFSQFGKYVPGKAWVIVMRVGLLKGWNVSPTVVVVTGTYEAITNMAAGAVVGVCLLPWAGLGIDLASGPGLALLPLALLPLALLGLNRLARRVASKYRGPDAPPLPVPSLLSLAQGLAQSTVGWGLLGLSLWLTVCGLAASPPPITMPSYVQYTAGVAISYVIGFIVVVAPGGVGARELVLQQVLARNLAGSEGDAAAVVAAVIALVLRLVWTSFEVPCAVAMWFLRTSPPERPPPVEPTEHVAGEVLA